MANQVFRQPNTPLLKLHQIWSAFHNWLCSLAGRRGRGVMWAVFHHICKLQITLSRGLSLWHQFSKLYQIQNHQISAHDHPLQHLRALPLPAEIMFSTQLQSRKYAHADLSTQALAETPQSCLLYSKYSCHSPNRPTRQFGKSWKRIANATGCTSTMSVPVYPKATYSSWNYKLYITYTDSLPACRILNWSYRTQLRFNVEDPDSSTNIPLFLTSSMGFRSL